MRVPGKKTFQRFVRPLVVTARPGGLILGYHRIADDSWDPLGICVSPANFRQQLDILTDLFMPVSLSKLVETLNEGKDVKNMVALTFDDGYKDFIDNALPELNRSNLPATVFISSGFIGRTYWWDEVAQHFNPEERESSKPVISSGKDANHAARKVQDLCRKLSTSNESLRTESIEALRRSGKSNDARANLPGTMSADDLAMLARLPNIEIGSHAVNHPVLDSLDVAQQRQEITQSKQQIEKITGLQNVRGFSYPNGSGTERSRCEVAEAGYQYACCSQQDVVRDGVDLLRLPRVWAPNAGRNEFRKWLKSWRGFRKVTRT